MGNNRPPARPPGTQGVPRPLSGLKLPDRPALKRASIPSKEPTGARRPEPNTGSSIEPTLLLVGADDKFAPALRIALARHRMYVETASVDDVADTVVVTAPDLVLLVGGAARDGGAAVLEKLGSSASTSVVPVAILDDNQALDVRLRAFRHGAVAVIPRSASIDAIADEVARLAREIPERGGAALGTVGEATLAEFVNALGKELRSGILSLKTEGNDAPVRLVLGSGRPLAEFIDDFVTRVRGHVVKAEPLEYEFDDRAAGTVQLFGADTDSLPGSVSGLRVALADDDPARADVVAQELRARGATVVVIDLHPSDMQFSRLRQTDPEVLLIGEQHLQGHGYDLLRQMRRDTRLRWASLLVVRWEEVWSDKVVVPAIDRLTGALRALTEGDRALRERVDAGQSFDTRLEVTGPARCLRAIAASSRSLRVSIFNPRVRIAIDLSEGLVAGATAEPVNGEEARDDAQWDGTAAIAGLLVLSSGRVHVDPVQTPAATNVMATIDVALSLADQEQPPIAPSIPATTGSSYPPPASVDAPTLPRPPQRAPLETIAGIGPPEAAAHSVTNGFVPVGVTPPISFKAFPVSPAVGDDPFAAVPSPPSFPSVPIASGDAAGTAPASPLPPNGAAWTTPQTPEIGAPARSSFARQLRLARGPGVSAPIAALLVLLAAAQGALFVFTYWWLTRTSPSPETVAAAASASSALASAKASAPKVTPSSALEPEARPAPSSAAAPPSIPEAPVGVDESGNRAPSCEDLLEGVALPDGDFPGAAYEQQRMAERALVRGSVDEAQRCYCKAVRWAKHSPTRHIDLAQLMLIRRDGASAAQWAKLALELSPGNTKAYGLLGDGLARVGDVKGAGEAWFAAEGTPNPSAEQKQAFLYKSVQEANLSTYKRDWPRAERFYRRVILVDPENLKAALGLATSLLKLKEPKPAMRWAQRALVIEPRNIAARILLGDAHQELGQVSAAEMQWREALSLDPDNGEARVRLARAAKTQ
jgi:DNA-binding response OmpR family regulator/tetratricopeptide (TPR) repeat protein